MSLNFICNSATCLVLFYVGHTVDINYDSLTRFPIHRQAHKM